MSLLLHVVTSAVLILQGLLILLGAIGALRDPDRVSSMYSAPEDSARSGAPGYRNDPVLVLSLAPLQGAIAAVMMATAYAAITPAHFNAGPIAFVLGTLSAMEIGFVVVRFRANAKRGNSPWSTLGGHDRVVTRRGCVTSGVFAAVYAFCAVAFLLQAS
jgi:hypothetical protein